MNMPTIAQQQEMARDVTLYRIVSDFGDKSNTYRIDKIVACTPQQYYHVTIKRGGDPGSFQEADVWCDCMGFRRQTYNKLLHKHVVLALDYIIRGAPEWAEYTIDGTGRSAKVRFTGSSEDE